MEASHSTLRIQSSKASHCNILPPVGRKVLRIHVKPMVKVMLLRLHVQVMTLRVIVLIRGHSMVRASRLGRPNSPFVYQLGMHSAAGWTTLVSVCQCVHLLQTEVVNVT